MFNKIGSPQPIDIQSLCCVCNSRFASERKDGKLYCNECSPTINLSQNKDLLNDE